MDSYYGTVEGVVTLTGVTPEDIGAQSKEEMEDIIKGLLVKSSRIVEEINNQKYDEDTPSLVDVIVEMIVGNFIRKAIIAREGNIIQVSEFKTKMEDYQVLNTDINVMLKSLKMFCRPKGLL